jgi:hypothetical protein
LAGLGESILASNQVVSFSVLVVVVVSAFAGAPAGDVPAWAQAQDAMFADPEAGGSDKKAAPARPKAAPGTANHSVRPGSPFAHSCYTGDCPEPRNEKRFIVGLA